MQVTREQLSVGIETEKQHVVYNLADIHIDPPNGWDDFMERTEYKEAHSRGAEGIPAVQEYVLYGLGIDNILDAEKSVMFSPMGSTAAVSAIVGRVAALENNRKTILVSPLGYPSGRTWAIENGLNWHSISSQTEEPDAAFQRLQQLPAFIIQDGYVAIDYPNNPTGKTFPTVLRQTIDHVSSRGGRVIVDLAFGEFLEGTECRDLMNFTLERGGIVCVSISKFLGGVGQGMAIVPNDLVEKGFKARDLTRVFKLDGRDAVTDKFLFYREESDDSCIAAKHLRGIGDQLEIEKPQLIASLERIGLHVRPTDNRTPILVVESSNPGFYTNLERQGVTAMPLERFDNLRADGNSHQQTENQFGNNAVRIVVPPLRYIDDITARFLTASQL